MRVVLVWLLLLALFPGVHGYKIQELSVSIELEKKQEIYQVTLIATEPVDSFEFYHPGEIKAEIGGKELKVEESADKKVIIFPKKLEAGEKITFTITSPLKTAGEYLHKRFTTPVDIENFRLYIIFPRAVLPEVRTFNLPKPNCCASLSYRSSTSIPPDGIAISQGRVVLLWQRSLKAGEEFVVGLKMPAKKISPAYMAVFFLALSTFLLGFWYARRRKKDEFAQVFLNEEEQRIVEYIKMNGGEVLQENIWKSGVLPFSRPKVSRIISELEERGIVVREPYKKTFKVRLNL